jgi:glycosyltransferase involved in cell wall biosynthesis
MGPLKYRRYQRVIAISKGVEAQLRATGVPAAAIRLVHSAVPPADEQAAWSDDQFRKTFNLNEQDLVVLCVAQFIPRKGHDVLLEAWSEVVSACRDARLLLLGRGPEEERLRQKVKAAVYGGSVQFGGYRDDLRQFLGHAAVLAHPAVREGLGIAVLEAQAAGVPVVAARAGGLPEAVAEGVSGLLVEPQDAGQLAHALIRLLRDAELRRTFGAAGRRHVAACFGPAAMVAGNLAVYREVLEAGRA